MIFWQGYGFLAFAMPILAFIVCSLIGDVSASDSSDWFFFVPLLISSLACWFIGRSFHKNKGKILIDPDTGEEVLLKKSHTFWFIKLEYWGIIYGVASLVLLFDIVMSS